MTVDSSYLSEQQVRVLLAGINPQRVHSRDGMSHLQAYDVRRVLNTVFGFARWSADVVDVTMLYDRPQKLGNGKDGAAVAYRCTLRLTVCAPDGTVLATYTEAATGDGVMPLGKHADAHDFAIKTAESQALKRAAVNLGDQFGLSLYNAGSTKPLVQTTLVGIPAARKAAPEERVDAHITAPLAAEETAEQASGDAPDPRESSAAAPTGQQRPPRPERTVDPPENPAPTAREDSAQAIWAEALAARSLDPKARMQAVVKLIARAGKGGHRSVQVEGTRTLGVLLTAELSDARKATS